MERLAQNPLPALTPREREVADLLLQGWKSTAIAAKLRLSIKRIERLRRSLRKRFGVYNQVDLRLRLRGQGRWDAKTDAIGTKLTPIEEDIVALVFCGLKNEDIAVMISKMWGRKMTAGDVENSLYLSDDYGKQVGILKRLGVRNRVELAILEGDRLYSSRDFRDLLISMGTLGTLAPGDLRGSLLFKSLLQGFWYARALLLLQFATHPQLY